MDADQDTAWIMKKNNHKSGFPGIFLWVYSKITRQILSLAWTDFCLISVGFIAS